MNQPPATPTPSKRSESSSKPKTSITQAGLILETYRIYKDRDKPMPNDLQELVDTLREDRGTEITPKSKFIQDYGKLVIESRKEDMALHILADKITYAEKLSPADDDGEPLIRRGRSDQWYDRVPKPTDANEDLARALEKAMEAQGTPPKPKPDISFGYSDDAFDAVQLTLFKSLPKEYHLHSEAPWFPYMVVEWKSVKRPIIEAEQQALRDAAAANDTLFRFFKLAYPAQGPPAYLTCVFSLCVHCKGFDYRVHWRRFADEGTISWEGDVVADARWNRQKEVFHARGAIMKTLDWVRGVRLKAIRAALMKLRTTLGPTALPTNIILPTPPASRKQAPKTPLQGSPEHKRRRLIGGVPESDGEDELA
ncbi:MAG: hypothetical protein Q9173_003761 [Seirophora scorigena]